MRSIFLAAFLAFTGLRVAYSQTTISLSSCTRTGDLEYCLGAGGRTVLWSSYTPTQTTPLSSPATTTPAVTTSASAEHDHVVTAVSGCHQHGSTQFCVAGTAEYQVSMTATPTGPLPSQYTGCHAHGEGQIYCFAPDGNEVLLIGEEQSHNETGEHEESSGGRNCHSHAGVEHCVGGDEEASCEMPDRDYNIPLRIGLIFVMFATSAIAVFGPMAIKKLTKINDSSTIFVALRQFGTGVIISTAFVHLYTHAELMFGNECLGELEYESTTSAILIAGLLLAFLVEYLGLRFMTRNMKKAAAKDPQSSAVASDMNKEVDVRGHEVPVHSHSTRSTKWEAASHSAAYNKLSVYVFEAGIIFHSLLIGLSLVVASDTYFGTLFAVIVFHQMFEGIALGTRIAALPSNKSNTRDAEPGATSEILGSVSFIHKLLMCLAFALVTPIGMAIGIGVISRFNGNDRSTLIALGTLDALSAGILTFVGLVDMLAADWLYGVLVDAPVLKTLISGVSLAAGCALMSFLGKWA